MRSILIANFFLNAGNPSNSYTGTGVRWVGLAARSTHACLALMAVRECRDFATVKM